MKFRLKTNENHKIVQSQVNEIDKLRAKYNQENPLSQFILGTINGAWDSVNGNANVILHPLETINGIKDAVTALAGLSLNAVKTKYVDNLSETTRRNVDTHDLLGGHIRDKHIGRSENWLRDRLKNDKSLADVEFAKLNL